MERIAAGNQIIHTSHSQIPNPPNPQNPNPKIHHHRQQQWRPKENPNSPPTPRRTALLLLLSSLPAAIPSPSPASALSLSFGIQGPKEWLKDQKRKASRFVLAPIEASRRGLRSAYSLLESDSPLAANSEEIQGILAAVSRDCVPQARTSLVAFQSGAGVEVCTFSLILNNAASLLEKDDPVKLEAEARLADVVKSLSNVGKVVEGSDFQLVSDREKVKDGLTDAVAALDKFEQGIKDCLGV
ncbi:uncharacterized protein M6B38_315330 [Iris pallida]|uniref:Uncharacterized protein n=1 Tax=Iris pallida TaxID=29817 RepID=A0AAX6HFC2_IRIPA|nr:uncharacterized protein M6B38_315330 [Iris pallida]